ncbi:hypothetical protein [Marinomonas sp. IMCC 4694]|uniref:hypothetical protein n=1 Tax=Marinomonas sp. IMCC 4694 TaxID=2605432 RepID=UPI0011E6BCAD|nr:hypothetical protein [Marinomonas sp. IMCC 4694]TYL47725.1 hypothetical protein FXV75_07105 [Marinomonas sp. IMCC 4694]
MTALIVIFITLSLMGSALWIMPPKKERQRMALRLHARSLGLHVQLTSIDLPDKWDKSMIKQKTVAYSAYRPKPLGSIAKPIFILPYEVWKYHQVKEGWWSNAPLVLSDLDQGTLDQYGGVLLAVKITSEGVAIYWDEAGDDDALETLSGFIFSLLDLPC